MTTKERACASYLPWTKMNGGFHPIHQALLPPRSKPSEANLQPAPVLHSLLRSKASKKASDSITSSGENKAHSTEQDGK
uniref:uncharacterized protein C9orf153 homolog isoform X2 n=1 Tax=Ictidomys tridecemlineatus TaxID=43179 RepID=UPI001A9E71B2|nr:uncharacterized protein C9orf153 homolog isoform X2 [Ictidomys tridecemlineatus]